MDYIIAFKFYILYIIKPSVHIRISKGKIFACTTYFQIAIVSFAAYTMSSPDNILTAEKAFVSLAYFNILREPLEQLPALINSMIMCHVSHSRIYKFLLKRELDPNNVLRNSEDAG